VRAFKTMAGLEHDEPAEAWVFAVYIFLLCMAMTLLMLWFSGETA
jgi:hypothetical protein